MEIMEVRDAPRMGGRKASSRRSRTKSPRLEVESYREIRYCDPRGNDGMRGQILGTQIEEEHTGSP